MTPRSSLRPRTSRRAPREARACALRALLAWALLAVLLVPLWPQRAAAALPPAPAFTTAFAALVAGTQAVVRADGDCLRVRAAPSLAAQILECVPEGTRVSVLEGATQADGLAWQRVSTLRATGWAATQYLQDAGAAPPPAACPLAAGASASAAVAAAPAPAPPPPPPALAGSLPADGGFGLVVWAGAATAAIAAAAEAGGCALRSVWATDDAGAFIHYHFGAPAFVNQAWADHFAGGELPSGTALLARCESGDAAAANALRAASERASSLDSTDGADGTDSAVAQALVPAAAAAPPQRSGPQAIPNVSAYAGVIVDAASGAVLWEKRAHEPLPPASLTKIATAILAIESGKLDASVPIDIDARLMADSTVMGLRPGDCFRVRDLLYGLMLASGNDAALAIGRAVSGSDAAFVAQMNGLLGRLELRESRFVNPHGLDAAGHEASATDLALLSRYALSLPMFADVVRTSQWQAQGSRTVDVYNVNSFLARYGGADGVKTGFTEDAGRTLVASATRDGRRVIVTLLNAPARDDDAQLLLDWVFGNFSWR